MAPFYGLAQHTLGAAVPADPLTGGGGVPGTKYVAIAQPHRIDAEVLGDPLHVDLGRELRLRRAESAERAVWRRIGHRHAGADTNAIAAVRARGVDGPAGEDHRTERDVRAAVEHGLDVDGRQVPVARD